jgi:small subunit ribosomal protein S17
MTAGSGAYGGRKILEGTVVSDKMENTVLVSVEERMRHRLYKKTVKRQRRFMAHDEELRPQMGDRVRIVEARPMSRHKRWLVIEVVERAELPEVAAESIDLELLGEVKTPVEEETAAPAAVASAEPVAGAAVEEPVVEAAAESEAVSEEIAEPEAEPEAEEVVPMETPEEPVEEVAKEPVATEEDSKDEEEKAE